MSKRTERLSKAGKPTNFKESWAKLFRYMENYKFLFIFAIVLSCIGSALLVIGPDLIRNLTDVITEGLMSEIDMQKVTEIASVILIIYLVSTVVNLVQGLTMAHVTQKTTGNLRRDISRKFNKLPLKFFDGTTTGDLMSRVTNDADTMGQEMNRSIGLMISSVTMLIASLIMMAYTNWIMMFVVIVSTLIGFFIMGFLMKVSQKYFNMQQENLGAMNGHVAEIYQAHDIVKAYNGGKKAKEKFTDINIKLRHTGFMSQFLSGLMMPIMIFMGNFGYVAVCIAGAILVTEGLATMGVIVAFIVYVRLFTQPLQNISQAVVSMQAVAAAAERVFALLEEDEMEDESKVTEKVHSKGHVEFKDVHFGYLPDKEIIHGFSAVIEPGQKVAIVGPTGAGKTTIVNLLMKFYKTNSGDILIDGVPINDMTRENVHEQFCMVLQDTWLFEGTIKENVIYCREGITDQQVRDACDAVGLHHFIETLPNGYDTVLKDDTSLSIGQRQQLTIARAILDTSPMLILDEATSSVDTRTEKIIQSAMDRLADNRTSFVIAHRLSTIRNSDLILVLKDGSIIEQGTHDTLLSRKGYYSELYNNQFDECD